MRCIKCGSIIDEGLKGRPPIAAKYCLKCRAERRRQRNRKYECVARNVRRRFSKSSGIGRSAELDLDFGACIVRVAWSSVRRMRMRCFSKSRPVVFNPRISPARQPVMLISAHRVE